MLKRLSFVGNRSDIAGKEEEEEEVIRGGGHALENDDGPFYSEPHTWEV